MCEKDQLAKLLADIERIQKLVRDSDAQVARMNLQLIEQPVANSVTNRKPAQCANKPTP